MVRIFLSQHFLTSCIFINKMICLCLIFKINMNKFMKYYLQLSICLCFLSGFLSCESNSGFQSDRIIISGQIENYNADKQLKYIEFVHPNMFALKMPFEAVEIDSLGHFYYESELVSPALCWGIYKKWFPFVISPGDSLFLTINGKACFDKAKEYVLNKYDIQISGRTAENYEEIIEFRRWASDSIYNREHSRLVNDQAKVKSSSEFKMFIENWEQEVSNEINHFGDENNVNTLFYNILRSELKYKSFENLLSYAYLNPMLNGDQTNILDLPESYYSFLEREDNFNSDYFTQRRSDFIHSLVTFLYFKNTSERQTYLAMRRNWKNAKIEPSYIKNQVSYIEKQTIGVTRDLCLQYFALDHFNSFPELADCIYKEVVNLIQDKYILERFKSHFSKAKEELTPKNINVKSNELTVLDSVIKSNKGKIIYVDFWAPWCRPCMREMPHAKILKKNLNSDEVVFVYLACKCKEKTWKATISKEKIEGVNLRLSSVDYGVLRRRYKIEGIPHFLLFGKDGKLLNDHAPRPSSDQILSDIKKLL